MSDRYRTITILIASPSDVSEERDCAERVIHRLEMYDEDKVLLRLIAKRWEFDAASEMGSSPQEIITRQIVDECDCAICIFWTRIGTPTEVAPGGAVEELERMVQAKKLVMLYFSSALPDSLDAIDFDQFARLGRWKKTLNDGKCGLMKTYRNVHEFEAMLARELRQQLLARFGGGSGGDRDAENSVELEQLYCATLKEELCRIKILGSPDIDGVQVKLDDTFVPLRMSELWRSDKRLEEKHALMLHEEKRHRTPDEVMQLVFPEYRMLLVIGDPGSGKTTLMKYYALCCLEHETRRLFGENIPARVFYLPLRELGADDWHQEMALPQQLSIWAEKHSLSIDGKVFEGWLRDTRRKSLVLLDGLDEISDLDRRKVVCGWIDCACNSFPHAAFVVTSRFTGYRQVDGIVLTADHQRVDVMDFTEKQQEEFLDKWFRAAFERELPPVGVTRESWKESQQQKAVDCTKKIVACLQEPKNRGLREMAAVPMLLQIMAILFRARDFLPENRVDLYRVALDYLLEFRDKQRKMKPLLPALKARLVLSPVSLWMQESLHADEALKDTMHIEMQKILKTFDSPPTAEAFCRNLVERAGVLVTYGKNEYLFRHKTFREYLAGGQLARQSLSDADVLDSVIPHFGEDWWNEPLIFFASQIDDQLFDSFISKLFDSPVSESMDQKQQTLLDIIIREAPQKKIDALRLKLLDPETTRNRQRSILQCLQSIGSDDARDAVRAFATPVSGVIRDADMLQLAAFITGDTLLASASATFLHVWQNPHEQNAQYILIPGGSYLYSLTEKEEIVGDLFFARYTVTNKLYRSFIAWLEAKELSELRSAFQAELEAIAMSDAWGKEFADYLKKGKEDLAGHFRSNYDEDRKYNGDDQPVVGVTWYAARAYALWLSLLEGEKGLYRLPSEVEWEWAAGGKQGTTRERVRSYPWPEERGEPSPALVNYNQNIGTTTPVGRYPEGATPEGLYDMAGNVDEWMENWYDKDEDCPSIRGGNWYDAADALRCSSRGYYDPRYGVYNNVGFRVIRSSHFSLPEHLTF
jgi:formylglycine-generating enzyme required for sulfatase activity/energy-coupling factor transporter ATP-binding protein EcfA2